MANEIQYLNMNSLRLTNWIEESKYPDSLVISLNTSHRVGFTCFFSDRDRTRVQLSATVLEVASTVRKYLNLLYANEDKIHVQMSLTKKYDDVEHTEVLTLGRNKLGLCYLAVQRDENASPVFKFILGRGVKIITDEKPADNREGSYMIAVTWCNSLLEQIDIASAIIDGKNVRSGKTGSNETMSRTPGGSTQNTTTKFDDLEDDIPF